MTGKLRVVGTDDDGPVEVIEERSGGFLSIPFISVDEALSWMSETYPERIQGHDVRIVENGAVVLEGEELARALAARRSA